MDVSRRLPGSRRSAAGWLLAASTAVVVMLAAGGLALRVGAAENSYRSALLFSEALSLVLENYVDPVEPESLLEGAYEGMVGGLDAHGTYLTPKEVAEWEKSIDLSASAAGPGVHGVKHRGSYLVTRVEPGSPAEAAGIVPGDQIRAVDGRWIRDLSMDQVLRALRGPQGSAVTLDLIRPSQGFKRERLEVARALPSGPAYRLEVRDVAAVLTIFDPTRTDPEALREELDAVADRAAPTLLVDLRWLPDVSPREVTSVVQVLAPGGKLVLKDRQGQVAERLEIADGTPGWKGPIAVLVSSGTAWGGEALAALIQTRRHASVWGEKTFGLGSEPRLFRLPDGSGVLIPAYLWEIPPRATWHQDGIQPDEAVALSGLSADAAEAQLRAVLEGIAARDEGAEQGSSS